MVIHGDMPLVCYGYCFQKQDGSLQTSPECDSLGNTGPLVVVNRKVAEQVHRSFPGTRIIPVFVQGQITIMEHDHGAGSIS